MKDGPSDAPAEASELDREAAALARSSRRLEAAHELVEVGLTLARRLAEDESPIGDVALAYSRIARAVRMSLALEAMIDGDVQVRVDRARAEAYSNRQFAQMREAQENADKGEAMIREAVRWAIETDTADRGDRRETERLYRELEEVLEDDHDWEAMVGMPLHQAVEYVCRELGVPFDKALWIDGEDEGGDGDPGAPASELADPADPPDALDRALELANRGGDAARPPTAGKPRPP